MTKEVLEFLSKTLNLDADSAAALLFKKADDGTLTDQISENALSDLLAADAARVEKLKGSTGNTKEAFDNGHKAGKKEAMEAFEKQLKSRFPTDSTATGFDLVQDVISSIQKGTIAADKVKTSPEYLALERQLKEQIDATNSEWQKKLSETESAYTKKEKFNMVKSRLNVVLEGLNPVLPSNPQAAQTQREYFFREFQDLEYQIEGDRIVALKDGESIKNAQGYVVPFEELVKSKASNWFDFHKQEQRGTAGNEGGAGAGSAAPIKIDPKYKRREDIAFDSTITSAERLKLYDAWDAANGGK